MDRQRAAFNKGVANVRGVILPIVDMRIRFDPDLACYDIFAVVIVLNICGASRRQIVVDAVSDVVTLTPEQLRPMPEFNFSVAADHMLAIGVIDDRMLILVTSKGSYSPPTRG